MPDRWARYKKTDEFRVQAPKSVQDACEIKSISQSGIFEVGRGGIYTKTYKFKDINFETASVDEQIMMLDAWCRWLNTHNEKFKISINNRNRDMDAFKRDILFARKMDADDDLRDSFNEIIEERILEARQGITQELYITLRCDTVDNYEDAKTYFNSVEVNMERDFKEIGSEIVPLNAKERLRVIHDVYRFGRESEFYFNLQDFLNKGWDFKDAVVGTRLDFSVSETWFRADDKYLSAVYVKTYPGILTDRYLTRLFALNIKMLCSIDVAPISREDVDKRLRDLYIGVQQNIRRQNKKRIKERDFSSDISYSVQQDQSVVINVLNNVINSNEHIFWTGITILVIADSLDQLKKDVALLKRSSNNMGVVLDHLYTMQKEALNTVLPIGVKQVDTGKPLMTKSMRALFPFNVQELMVKGGNWYGTNKVSKNLCIGNRKSLINGNGFVFGITGSGKTSAVKLDIMQNYLKTKDVIIVIDPKGDYQKVVEKCHGAVIELSSTAMNTINPLAFYGNNRINIADEKAEVVFAICEACKKAPLDAIESSVVNRALKRVYMDTSEERTLADLDRELSIIARDETIAYEERNYANQLHLYMERFISGSLNMFATKTNVNVNNRLIDFDMSKLGKEMWDLGILVMLEYIQERIMKNYDENIATWLYVDELHVLLKNQAAQVYLLELWKKVRSFGGLCTGITQNVGDILANDTTIALLENSEFIMLLKQNQVAFDKLIQTIGISQEQVKYITSESGSGRGLLKHGQCVVPVDMTLPKDSELYDLIDTNAHERFAALRGAWSEGE